MIHFYVVMYYIMLNIVSVQTKDRVRTFRFNWWASNMLDKESARKGVSCTKGIEECLIKCLGHLYPNASRDGRDG